MQAKACLHNQHYSKKRIIWRKIPNRRKKINRRFRIVKRRLGLVCELQFAKNRECRGFRAAHGADSG